MLIPTSTLTSVETNIQRSTCTRPDKRQCEAIPIKYDTVTQSTSLLAYPFNILKPSLAHNNARPFHTGLLLRCAQEEVFQDSTESCGSRRLQVLGGVSQTRSRRPGFSKTTQSVRLKDAADYNRPSETKEPSTWRECGPWEGDG